VTWYWCYGYWTRTQN